MARTTTFQRSLFQNLAGMVLLLGILFAATAYFYSERAKQQLAQELTGRAVSETQATILRFLQPVSTKALLAAHYFTVAGVNLDDPLELDRFLRPTLMIFGQISGASVARSDGSSYTIKRTESGWERRLSEPGKRPGRAFISRWVGDHDELVEGWEQISYDARTRPWFIGAAELYTPGDGREPAREEVYWSRPYPFFEPEGAQGVTASLAFTAPDGEMHVVSFDVLLRDVSTFTMDLRLKESGSVAVLYHDMVEDELLLAGLPVGVADTREEALEQYLLAPPTIVGGALVDYVAAVLADEPEKRARPRQFQSGDRTWWGAAASAGTSQEVWILAMVPEDELLVDFRQLRLVMLVGTPLFVLLALWRSLVLSSLYARPVEALASQSERMAGLNFERLGISATRIEELRMLAEAQEQLRHSFEAISSRREDLPIARSLRASPKQLEGAAPVGYQLAGLDRPMENVGGGVFAAAGSGAPGSSLSLLLAVVPGEGVAAAHEGGRLRSAFATSAGLGAPIEETVRQLRAQVGDAELAERLALCVAELDVRDHSLAVRTQPSCPVLHLAAASGETRWVDGRESAVPARIDIAPGDTVLLMTESVLHGLSSQRERFGPERLEAVVREHAGEDAATLASRIDAALDDYSGATLPERDRVLLVLQRRA